MDAISQPYPKFNGGLLKLGLNETLFIGTAHFFTEPLLLNTFLWIWNKQ